MHFDSYKALPFPDLISIYLGSVIVIWKYSIFSFEFVSTSLNLQCSCESCSCMCAIKYPWREKKETRKNKIVVKNITKQRIRML